MRTGYNEIFKKNRNETSLCAILNIFTSLGMLYCLTELPSFFPVLQDWTDVRQKILMQCSGGNAFLLTLYLFVFGFPIYFITGYLLRILCTMSLGKILIFFSLTYIVVAFMFIRALKV